jgi:hypothetical protein
MLRLRAAAPRARGESEAGLRRDVELLSAQAGALVGALRALVGSRVRTPVQVPPARLLEGVVQALQETPHGRVRVGAVRARGLPDLEADAELLHHLLLGLGLGAIEAAAPRGRLELSARREGRRVALRLADDAPPIELSAADGPPRRGRAFGLRLAAVLLAREGGSLAVASTRRGNRIELRLPAARARRARSLTQEGR